VNLVTDSRIRATRMHSRCQIGHVPKGICKTKRTALPFVRTIASDSCDDTAFARTNGKRRLRRYPLR
jgi:hypothetical protein